MYNQNLLGIVTENFPDVGAETAETILDSLLEEGAFKNIPGVGTIIAIAKTGKRISKINYLKKIKAFIYGYSQTPDKLDKRILSDLEDEEKRNAFRSKILLIIDSVDAETKAELIGKAAKLMRNGEIDSVFFLRLCHKINKSYYDDLLLLTHFTGVHTLIGSNTNVINASTMDELSSNGLLKNCDFESDNIIIDGKGTVYGLNEYGTIIQQLLK